MAADVFKGTSSMQIKFHWSWFLRVQLTTSYHLFRYWLGTRHATSYYLHQWWPSWQMHIYASFGLSELMFLMLRLECSSRNRSIQWLLMPWLLVLLGHEVMILTTQWTRGHSEHWGSFECFFLPTLGHSATQWSERSTEYEKFFEWVPRNQTGFEWGPGYWTAGSI